MIFDRKAIIDLMDQEILDCSNLFSSAYGIYDANSPIRPGSQIKLGAKQYKLRYCKEGVYVARGFEDGKLVGHAIYIRKRYEPYGTMTWVLQLVVAKEYRLQHIASKLLRSIWGFSDDFAWGLASANPCTVKTLESATFRKCNSEIIKKNLDAIKIIGKDTTFVKDDSYVVDNNMAQVDTEFFADNSEYPSGEECEKKLGKLRPGHEWLAFTFKEQPINRESYRKHFVGMIESYESILKDAYGRMKMDEHPWTKGTENEIRYIMKYGKNENVLDLGCGIGRHSIALAEKGSKVTAVDNSPELIKQARLKVNSDNIQFVEADVRMFRDGKLHDKVICLYDVVGSYPKVKDNKSILKTAYEELKPGGYLILSVMNMELTESLCKNELKGKISQNPEILERLLPSNTMQKSGMIFNPDYYAIDTERNLVYRKEQFSDDQSLPAEYIIRDKRYTMKEISDLLEESKFEIVESNYVQAGKFDVPLEAKNEKAKEICIVCRKKQ